MQFKDRLKELREEAGLSINKIAEIMGVSKVSAWQWESGLNFPKELTLEKMADYFNVSLDYLMGRTNVRHSNPNNNIQFAFADYEKLTDDQKEIIKNLAASLIAQNEAKKK